jgi:hypothetical protein
LRGVTAAGALARIGLPPLEQMFNPNGTAYAAETAGAVVQQPLETRFVLWFNGNGIPERYWIPAETGPNFTLTPCLSPLAPFRDDVHVITGLDNAAAGIPGPGNPHHRSMSGLVSGKPFTGRGAGGPSFDQLLAEKIGRQSRFSSLQIGVCPESHGDSIQRNLSWAGRDRALPPEMIPHELFDRIFGVRDQDWVDRKKSVLDTVRESAGTLQKTLGATDRKRLDEYMGSVRDMERSISSLPPEYRNNVEAPEEGGDMRDWPRIAKLQTDLMVHALASGQTRVATYMLTKCQSLTRMPWLGYTTQRHHDYTHYQPGSPEQQRTLRDITRWHVQEFAYFLAKLKSIPEGDGSLFDHCCLLYLHEHAEANDHKNNGMVAIMAGRANGMIRGAHSKLEGVIGDLYLAIADDIMGANLGEFPAANRKLKGIVA